MKKNEFVILAGDHPDPSIVQCEEKFYLSFTTCRYKPSIVLYESFDLVNWKPCCAPIENSGGDIWVSQLVKVDDRYHIYFYQDTKNYVIWTNDILGNWSDPIDIGVSHIIDAGFIQNNDKKFLYFSHGHRVQLDDKGFRAVTPLQKAFEGWKFPDSFSVEGNYLESPKIFEKDGLFHFVWADGGTAGPPTAHMAVHSVTSDLENFEHSPYNPIIHTENTDEDFWCKGHATVFPYDGRWFAIYHAYLKNAFNLGRFALLSEIEFIDEKFFKLKDESKYLEEKFAQKQSTDYSTEFSELDLYWSFFNKIPKYIFNNGIIINDEKDNFLTYIMTSESCRVETEIENNGGLLFFYNDKHFAGIGCFDGKVCQFSRGQKCWEIEGEAIAFRAVKRKDVVDCFFKTNDNKWHKAPQSFELSGYQHNILGGFLFLKIALFAKGGCENKFKKFSYENI